MNRTSLSFLRAALLVLLTSVVAARPVYSRSLVIPHLAGSIEVNGRLDEAVWENAARAEDFYKAGQGEVRAKEQTRVRIFYDDRAIHVGFDCDDDTPFSRDTAHDQGVWKNDCVEVFFSKALDYSHAFHFIADVKGQTYDVILGQPQADYEPEWQVATHERAGGFSVEMRIPFAALEEAARPRQGMLWAVKLAREHYDDNGKVMLFSSWSLIATSFEDPSAFADLYFESANTFINGDLEDLGEDGLPVGWILPVLDRNGRQTRYVVDRDVVAEGAQSLRVESCGWDVINPGNHTYLQRGRKYRFSFKIRAADPKAKNWIELSKVPQNETVVPQGEGWKEVVLYADYSHDPASVIIPRIIIPGGTAWIDDCQAVMIRDMPSGLYCLTGNALPALARFNRVPADSGYTYYRGGTTDPLFPYAAAGETEGIRHQGWVGFSKGRLTNADLRDAVSWGQYWLGLNGVDVVFDLGADYYIGKIELQDAFSNLGNVAVYFKTGNAERYTLRRPSADLPFRGPTVPGKGYHVIEDCKGHARWIRMKLLHRIQRRSYMGLSEVRIWGRPLAEGEEPTPGPEVVPAGWAVKDVDPPEIEIAGVRLDDTLYPVPREISRGQGEFVFGSSPIITTGSDARDITTAEVLRDEFRIETGSRATCQTRDHAGRIIIGTIGKNAALDQAVKAAGVDLSPTFPGPEAYVLLVKPDRVLVAGSDERGTIWGVQTLIGLLESKGANWTLPEVTIRDWPQLSYRFLSTSQVFRDPKTRLDEGRRLIRALSRYKINYVEFLPAYGMFELARQLVPFAERYGVRIVPSATRMKAIERGAPVERAPDEALAALGRGRHNPNPAHAKTWEVYEKLIAEVAPHFNAEFVNIGLDEMYQANNGSRWNVSAESRAMKLHGHELMAYYINRIQKILDRYGKRALCMDTSFTYKGLSYPGDDENDWTKIKDLVDKKVIVSDWHHRVGGTLKDAGFTVLYWTSSAAWGADWKDGYNINMLDGSFRLPELAKTIYLAWNRDARGIEYGSSTWQALNASAIHKFNEIMTGLTSPIRGTGKDNLFAIELRGVANRSRVDAVAGDGKGWVDQGPGRDLRALKPGLRNLADVRYDIIDEQANNGLGVVMVENPHYFNRTMPQRVEIPVGRKTSGLSFLHALTQTAGHHYDIRDELAGQYLMLFEDGTYDSLEIKYNVTASNWDVFREDGYAPRGDGIGRGTLAWKGRMACGLEATLYATDWTNPKPEIAVEKIVFQAGYRPQTFSPILLAVTGANVRRIDVLRAEAAPANAFRPVARLYPEPAQGRLIDLSGGVEESATRYLAPDGIRVETNHGGVRKVTPGTEPFGIFAAMIYTQGTVATLPQDGWLRVTLPKPRKLTSIGVFGYPRHEKRVADFPANRTDYILRVSADGDTFEEMADVRDYIPEEQGPVYHNFEPREIKVVEIRVKRAIRRGLSWLGLYEAR